MTTIESTLQNRATKPSFLKRALYGNAIFSGISGLDFIIFSNRITEFLGWSTPWLIPAIGVGLLLFATFIVTVARTVIPNSQMVKTIIASDIAWIVLSCIIIFLPTGNLLGLTVGGKWAVAILADLVLIFAVLQFLGLRRMNR